MGKLLEKEIQKTKRNFWEKLSRAFVGKSSVDDNLLDAIEEALISSDVGVDTTLKIIDNLEERVLKQKYLSFEELMSMLKEEIATLFSETISGNGKKENNSVEDRGERGEKNEEASESTKSKRPYIVMVVGVNGVGKTTTIAKLAHRYSKEGKKVFLGAADTFRAAAVEQLSIWADRVGVDIVKQNMGSDPSSVAFDTVKSALAKEADVVLIDTAGRLHNRLDLMNELSKIKKVISKLVPDAPDEVLLVLDASTGQNALRQAIEFSKATEVSSLAVTKLDGTAKGGVILSIVDQLKIPVKYVGVGEGMEDLKLFDINEFIDTLFSVEDIKNSY